MNPPHTHTHVRTKAPKLTAGTFKRAATELWLPLLHFSCSHRLPLSRYRTTNRKGSNANSGCASIEQDTEFLPNQRRRGSSFGDLRIKPRCLILAQKCSHANSRASIHLTLSSVTISNENKQLHKGGFSGSFPRTPENQGNAIRRYANIRSARHPGKECAEGSPFSFVGAIREMLTVALGGKQR